MSSTPPPAPPETWNRARSVAKALVNPVQRFLAVEAAGGLLLLGAVVLALAWANSPWANTYEAAWRTPIGFRIGSLEIEHSLHFWINEGLMTVFFFVVGLEIRREMHEGELSDFKRAALPLVAALGGVVVPALIYLALNAGRAGAGGWAIPMATDIAFAVGVLTLLGSRAPQSLRVLLLALAVIDDIAAIIVIAVAFSSGLSLAGFGIAAAGLGAIVVLRGVGVRQPIVYIAPGVGVWAGLLVAGIHPTLAGVLVGLLAPVRPWFGAAGFKQATQDHLAHLDAGDGDLVGHLDEIERARREALSPAERLIHVLHPYVAFGVMPLFALANAGVGLAGASISGDGVYVFAGIVAGLALGKPVGIALASRLHGGAPPGALLVGLLGGIGFTMSLFIAQLALPPGELLATAKLAILVGSVTAAIAGLVVGRSRRSP